MLLSILCASIASISYALFSRHYEGILRASPSNIHPPIILYAVAGTMLCITASLAFIVFGGDIVTTESLLFKHGTSDFILQPAVVGAGLLMILCYAVHIHTEAQCRGRMNMGIYAILFQLSVATIGIVDQIFYELPANSQQIRGCVLIIIASIGSLLIHLASEASFKEKISTKVGLLAALSAITCGLALSIDGELMRTFVVGQEIRLSSLSPFLLYESTTFLFPALALYLFLLCTKRQGAALFTRELPIHFMRYQKPFLYSAFFSACQFVFSVLALAIPGPRLLPAAVLASAPLLCILIDQNKRRTIFFFFEICCAAIVVGGICLVIR